MRSWRVGSGVAEELEETLGVGGVGDVEVAEGVTPLGGDEGGVGTVVEAEGLAVGDVEGEFVAGVGDGEAAPGWSRASRELGRC